MHLIAYCNVSHAKQSRVNKQVNILNTDKKYTFYEQKTHNPCTLIDLKSRQPPIQIESKFLCLGVYFFSSN